MFIINLFCYFFTFLFFRIAYKSKLYKLENIKALWNNSVIKIKTKARIETEISKAEKRGEKPFTMPDGTIIYAKTQQGALFQYKKIKKSK